MRIINKKGLHDYHILESLEAGIQLTGSEVKSVRAGRVDLGQAHAKIINGEVFLINANIPAYQNAPIKNYDPIRSRKLLLHHDQTISLVGKLSGKGVALIPVSLYEKNNMIKLELGLGKSKKEYDKRRIIKEKDQLRRIEQEIRGKE